MLFKLIKKQNTYKEIDTFKIFILEIITVVQQLTKKQMRKKRLKILYWSE